MKRFAIFGAGFWSFSQLGAWQEVGRAECVAIVDPNLARARALAEAYGIEHVFADRSEILDLNLDFVDIISPVETHAELVKWAAGHGLGVICQKPMGRSLAEAASMVRACAEANVPFGVHENYRWQAPFRALKAALAGGAIGTPFRCVFDSITSYPVFQNQPALAELEDYILTDMGSHILDMARCLFGEADTLYCQAHQVHPGIAGEDAATVMMRMTHGVTVVCNIAEAETPLEDDPFVETLVFVEGDKGSAEITKGFRLKITTKEGTVSTLHAPPRYPWAHPDYFLSQSAMVACIHDLVDHLEGKPAENSGVGNLETVRLVFGAYESFRGRKLVTFER